MEHRHEVNGPSDDRGKNLLTKAQSRASVCAGDLARARRKLVGRAGEEKAESKVTKAIVAVVKAESKVAAIVARMTRDEERRLAGPRMVVFGFRDGKLVLTVGAHHPGPDHTTPDKAPPRWFVVTFTDGITERFPRFGEAFRAHEGNPGSVLCGYEEIGRASCRERV